MCARFCLAAPTKVIGSLFEVPDLPEFEPKYNIAPSTPIAAFVQEGRQERELRLFRWGLAPSWIKDPNNGPINARAETAHEKPMFRTAIRRRRCLVPATGFFEWREEGGIKQPYLFSRKDGAPFALGGIWETWEGFDGYIESVAILTTQANRVVAPYHDRMPVVVPRDRFSEWVDPSVQKLEAIADLLGTQEWPDMRVYPVDRRVGNPRFQSPTIIEPLASQPER